MQPVVAQRQIGRQHECGLADESTVEIERRGEVVGLPDVVADAAVFQSDPYLRRVTMGDVHPERGVGARTGHDRWR